MTKAIKAMAVLACSFGLLGVLPGCNNRSYTSSVPVITAQPTDLTVTAPDPVRFSVLVSDGTNFRYAWRDQNKKLVGTTANLFLTPSALYMNGNTYTVTVSNDAGSVDSIPVRLTVKAAPDILTQPGNALVGEGQPATFTVVAESNPPVSSYQWQLDEVDIPGATKASFATAPVTDGMNGKRYRVILANGIGAPVASESALLTVGLPPVITSQPVPRDVIAPAEATFTVAATGRPLSYQWYGPSGLLAGQTSATLRLAPTKGEMAGGYKVTVSAFGAPVDSATVQLNIIGPPVITTQPQGATVSPGAPLHLGVVVLANPVPTYQWFHGNAKVGANAASYDVPAAASTDSGTYHVQVSNAAGTVDSATVTVTVAENHAILGRVSRKDGSPAAGIALAINTTPPATVPTDAFGAYRFPAVLQGAWTITPAAPGQASSFQPPSAPVNLDTADVNADFQVVLGATVSGTVSYPGTLTGPVYLTLVGGTGAPLGTILPAGPGPFSIRGVPPGTYELSGTLDPSLGGVLNANDPTGKLNVPVDKADVSGLALALADPAPVTLASAPENLGVVPFASGAVVTFNAIRDADRQEQAERYSVEWSKDGGFAPATGSMFIRANGQDQTCFVSALDNGADYTFRVRGQAGTSESPNTPARTVRIAAPAGPGTATVSGSVNWTGAAEGPLYVFLVAVNGPNTGQFYVTQIHSPGNPQAFSIPGVPASADPNYVAFAFIDQNRNGTPDLGDFTSPVLGMAEGLVVNADRDGVVLNLNAAGATLNLGTSHLRENGSPNGTYWLVFRSRDSVKHVSALTVLSGPNVLTPTDFGSPSGASGIDVTMEPLWGPPAAGQSYPVLVRYSDGNSETVTTAVKAVLGADAFVRNPRTGGPNQAQPVFQWDPPAAPPAGGYTLRFALREATGKELWTIPKFSDEPGLPSSMTSLPWDPADPTHTDLLPGTPYVWALTVRDPDGNEATLETAYTF